MPTNVLICGAGVAGLEAALTLRELAPEETSVTVLAPEQDFEVRARSVAEPFALAPARRVALADIAADAGFALVAGELASVDTAARTVRTASDDELSYEALLVAVGALTKGAVRHAATFGGPQDVEAMHGLLQDMEIGATTSIAFVVPPGASWPLPMYELALLTAERARSLDLDVGLTIVTAESAPLGLFGRTPSSEIARLLADAGIAVETSAYTEAATPPVLQLSPGQREVRADRVIALPKPAGRRIAGLPADADGFLPVDALGRVAGLEDVFGAGDGTTFPIKQGGIAAQQADVAARSIAAAAGADVTTAPLRPVLRGMLLTGSGLRYLRAAAGGTDPAAALSDHTLWWPPTKVAGARLGPYLFALGGEAEGSVLPSDADGVHVRVDAGDLELLDAS